MKLLKGFGIVFLFSFLSADIYSQSDQVRMTIRVVEIYGEYNAKNEAEDYRFEFMLNDSPMGSRECYGVNNIDRLKWIPVNFLLQSNSLVGLNEPLTIKVHAWEEDGCKDDCDYNNTRAGCEDGGNCSMRVGGIVSKNYGNGTISGATFMLKDLPPGEETGNIIEIVYCRYRVRFLVTYQPPTPLDLTMTINGNVYGLSSGFVCDDNLITLSTGNAIDPAFDAKVFYEWEYHIDGDDSTVSVPNPDYCGPCDFSEPWNLKSCCFLTPTLPSTVNRWHRIETTVRKDSGDSFTFDYRQLDGLKDIMVNKSVTFRTRIKVAGPVYSIYKQTLLLKVSPLPPTLNGTIPEASCPNGNTGIIKLNGMKGVGEYQYNLRPGFKNNSSCDPLTQNSCFSGIMTGAASGEDFLIENVPSGEYTLWLSNTALNSGNCSSMTDIAVDTIGILSLSLKSLQHVTCNGIADGKLTLEKSGGKEPFIFTVADTLINSSGDFVNLSPESYITSVKDGCNQVSEQTVKTFVINQPVKLSEAAFSLTDATCLNPGNGSVTVGVSKSSGVYDVAVSSTYQYRIFQGATLYQTHESFEPSWLKENLQANNYQMVVTEKGGQTCNGYIQNFTIAPPSALTVTDIELTQVTCHAGSDGNISFTGNGGSGEFLFKLAKSAGDTLQNIVGNFTNITSGDYALIIENNLPGCNDRMQHPDLIKIIQPDSIVSAFAVNDISCFGKQDGSIAATVTGGTPAYTLSWEKQFGSVWAPVNETQTTIANQGAGKYRLKVLDSRSCPDFSYSVLINEPAALQATTIVKDIVCFGESGNLITTGSGGVQPYSYLYSSDANTYIPLTATMPISAGVYYIRATDKNGCVFDDLQTYPITTPATQLDFTYTLSDYNGYNISCYGGNNGFVNVVATGGNGASYTGYQYTTNANIYQNENVLNQLIAGDHLIQVRDARGCVVSKTVSLIQTTEQLNLFLDSKEDVVCYGDENGSITVSGSGGLSPYSYIVNESEPQVSNQFLGLGVGSYQLMIQDKNNCTATLATQIVNLNPRIQMHTVVTDVRCYAGSDGAIDVTVTDGVSPYQFVWTGQTNTTSLLNNVAAGSYTVIITDKAGCSRNNSFVVNQPTSPVAASLAIVPVCYGKTNGSIAVWATGGTSPYVYAFSNALSFQSSPVLTAGVGTYPVTIKDNNGCTTTLSAEIIQRNDKPEPNFLVATKRNALDTLVIKEISVPKPDSVDWIFDPLAQVIVNDSWSPQIKFEKEGTYFVSMTGYFGGCEYAITKDLILKPYDPNAVPDKNPGYSPIESVVVSPNPSTGNFEIRVALIKKYDVSIAVYDILGSIRFNKNWSAVQNVSETIVLANPAPGVYLLRVITDTDARDIRLIVNQ